MIDLDASQAALQQLSQAIYWHEQWYKGLVRNLTCQLACSDSDVAEDAHRQCNFGRWYYGEDIPAVLRDQHAFIGLEVEHERMHRFAARLLRASMRGDSISLNDYEHFDTAIDRMHQTLYALKRQIEESLYGHDPLTGAANRTAMFERLHENLEMIRRNSGQSCIVLMDLDHFKKVNDTFGHLVGDQVLSASARCIIDHLRPYDKVFRYGGEEFLILMPNTSLLAGHAVAERIRGALAFSVHVQIEGKSISITASFGITLLDPNLCVEESIDRADKAMYAAKAAGRNRTCVWNSSVKQDPTPAGTSDTPLA